MVLTAGSPSSGELTFLFTDIEGSTAAWDRDERAMASALERHDDILHGVIDRGSGRVFSTAGDGVAAAFPRAERALTAAVAAQVALLGERWPAAAPVRVRMGLHTGRAIERDGDYFGPAVIRAARLMSLISGGRIVCSEATRSAASRSAPDDVEFIPIGSAQLKGLSRPEVVLAVKACGLPERGEPLEAGNPYAWSVPHHASTLLGREREVAHVVAALAGSWLVTLTGVGGVGKTRLALAVADSVADRFPAGRAFVDLAPVGAGDDVAQAVADALQVGGPPGDDLPIRIARSVGDQPVLLVLDNCEHVSVAVAELVLVLGRYGEGLTVLATSRERLHVDGEKVIHVGPLAVGGLASPAVALLTDRIDAALTQPELDAVMRIASKLDGLPLALELAAARCRTLGVLETDDHLAADLDLLGDEGGPETRHRTIDAALEWSHRMLAGHERAAFERLSVFAGSFTLDLAERLLGSGRASAAATLASLVDKSLIEHDGAWFRLLEPTRQFAEHRLDASDGRQAAERAHTEVVVDRVRLIHDALQGRDEAEQVRALDALWPDVRLVVRRSFERDDADTATAIAVHLALEALWRRPEAFEWIHEAVARYGDRDGPHRHELLGAGGIEAFTLQDPLRGIALGEAAVAADPEPGSALDFLPEVALTGSCSFAGRHDEAIVAARRAVALVDGSGHRWKEGFTRAMVGIVAASRGQSSDEAVEALRQASAISRALGNPTLMSFTVFTQGLLSLSADPASALLFTQMAKAWASDVRNDWVVVQSSITMATASAALGGDEEVLPALLESAGDLLRAGWVTHAWETLWGVIGPLHRAGRTEAAVLCLGACEASGVARYGYWSVPEVLEELTAADGDDRLHALRSMGPYIPIRDVLEIAAGLVPVPPVQPGAPRHGSGRGAGTADRP